MLTVPEASARILEHIAPLAIERVPLLDALGRVLAESVRAPMTLPAWDNSAMDGYAVRGADIDGATAERPVHPARAGNGRGRALRDAASRVTVRPFGS